MTTATLERPTKRVSGKQIPVRRVTPGVTYELVNPEGRLIKRASTALIKAKELLITEGFTKGCLRNSRGRHCSVGAVAEVTGNLVKCTYNGSSYDFRDIPDIVHPKLKYTPAAKKAIDLLSKFAEGDIIGLNDQHGTSKKKVLDIFDKAIAEAKRQERAAKWRRLGV